MATAESVKAKVQGLIDSANATTGNTDTDLTTAVGNLIAGFGQGGGGDTSIEDGLITGTLTEYTNDRVERVRGQVFRSFSGLKRLCFPSVKTIANYSIYGCGSLESVDFWRLESIPSTVFTNSSVFKTLILRSGEICNLSAAFTSVFVGCYHFLGTVNSSYNPNGLKDGYIYVPSALLDSYKTATNWSVAADQFRVLEEYTIDGTTTGEIDWDRVNGGATA